MLFNHLTKAKTNLEQDHLVSRTVFPKKFVICWLTLLLQMVKKREKIIKNIEKKLQDDNTESLVSLEELLQNLKREKS